MAGRSLSLALASVVFSATVPVAGKPPSLDEVIDRASAYVAAFERQLSSIVAEEIYEQFVDEGSPAQLEDGRRTTERRLLKSDLLLLRPENGFNWVQFRDVFEVDGVTVGDREASLAEQLIRRSASTPDVVNRIRRESARYNIGRVERTMNVPVLPLTVLDPRTKSRFRFRREEGSRAQPPSVAASGNASESSHFRVATELWVIGFEERRGPTLIRTPSGRNLFSRGRFWIEPDTGRVMMAEMITESPDVRAQLTVSYQSEPVLGFFVPIDMRERYSRPNDSYVVGGAASYGRFRPVPRAGR